VQARGGLVTGQPRLREEGFGKSDRKEGTMMAWARGSPEVAVDLPFWPADGFHEEGIEG